MLVYYIIYGREVKKRGSKSTWAGRKTGPVSGGKTELDIKCIKGEFFHGKEKLRVLKKLMGETAHREEIYGFRQEMTDFILWNDSLQRKGGLGKGTIKLHNFDFEAIFTKISNMNQVNYCEKVKSLAYRVYTCYYECIDKYPLY